MRRAVLAACVALVLMGAGEDAYLRGLDALERGDFGKAVDLFEESLAADDENPDHHVAAAAALAFAERFEPALRHLERAGRLRPGDKTTRLWTATVVAMSGGLFEDTKHYPAATRDPFETALREMSHRYGDPAFRAQRLREPDPNAEAVRAAERARFPDLARQFVSRLKPKQPQISGALKQRGIERVKRSEYASAYPDLLHAASQAPADLEIVHALALCRLALGAPEGARADFTRVLTKDVRLADAYLGRARAHAALGSADRARADLAVAKDLGADVVAAADAVEKALSASAQRPATTLRDVVADPRRAADLVREVEGRRRRADESYQDRLRRLRASGDLTALGAFLYEGATTTLTEWVEPRAAPRAYRPQDPEAELAEAEKVLDEALAKNPGDVRAMAFRAACRARRFDWDGARKQTEQALALAPGDPVVLEVVALVLDHSAAVAYAAAADLRAVKTWSDYWWITTRWPSQAELAQAKAYEQQARWLWQRARKALETAAAAEAGSPRGLLYEARLAEWDGDLAKARASLERAVAIDAAFLPGWVKLAEVLGRAGQAKEAYVAQFRAANLTHSTGAPMLKWAWQQIGRTAYRTVEEALVLAEEADPADPRVAAYRGVVAEGRGDAKGALDAYAAAWAVSVAAARLRGVAFDAAGPPLTPEEAALPMRLAFRVGRLRLAAGDAEGARQVLAEASPLLDRVEVAARYAPVPRAMLPSTTEPPDVVPEAPHVETIGAWIRLRLGDALYRLGRFPEAAAQFDWVLAFDARKPSVLPVGEGIREPAALASAHRARVARKVGPAEEARRFALSMPSPRALPPASRAEFEAIAAEVLQGESGAADDGPGGAAGDDPRRQSLLDARERLVAHKKRIEERLAAPGVSENERRRLRAQVSQLDRQLAEIDAALGPAPR